MSTDLLAEVSQKIKEARKIGRMNQTDLAKLCGISQRSVSKYERGDFTGGSAKTVGVILRECEKIILAGRQAVGVILQPGANTPDDNVAKHLPEQHHGIVVL